MVEKYVGVGVRHLRLQFLTNLTFVSSASFIRKVLEVEGQSETSQNNFDGGSNGQKRDGYESEMNLDALAKQP